MLLGTTEEKAVRLCRKKGPTKGMVLLLSNLSGRGNDLREEKKSKTGIPGDLRGWTTVVVCGGGGGQESYPFKKEREARVKVQPSRQFLTGKGGVKRAKTFRRGVVKSIGSKMIPGGEEHREQMKEKKLDSRPDLTLRISLSKCSREKGEERRAQGPR